MIVHDNILIEVLISGHANSESILVVFILSSPHGDLLSHVFVSDHSNGEELIVWNAINSPNLSMDA